MDRSTKNIPLNHRNSFFLGLIFFLFLSFPLHSFADESRWSGSIEGELILGGSYDQSASNQSFKSYDLQTSWTVRPSVDWGLNEFIWIGGELGLGWMNVGEDLFNDQIRQKVSPMIRLRMDFPINCRLILEGLFAGGIGILSELRDVSALSGGDRLWGGGFRMHLGLRYLVNTQMHLFLGGGYEQMSFSGDEVEVDLVSLPIVFGVRGQF